MPMLQLAIMKRIPANTVKFARLEGAVHLVPRDNFAKCPCDPCACASHCVVVRYVRPAHRNCPKIGCGWSWRETGVPQSGSSAVLTDYDISQKYRVMPSGQGQRPLAAASDNSSESGSM
jgi:hypothetical protein